MERIVDHFKRLGVTVELKLSKFRYYVGKEQGDEDGFDTKYVVRIMSDGNKIAEWEGRLVSEKQTWETLVAHIAERCR